MYTPRTQLIDLPVPSKRLPQIWIENDCFIIKAANYSYCINVENDRRGKKADPIKMLMSICRRMTPADIESTYTLT